MSNLSYKKDVNIQKSIRNHHFDVISGLMMIYMVLIIHMTDWAHLETSVIYNYGVKTLPFFMPFFFYKSGMFYKNNNSREQKIKIFKRLLLPYIVFSVAGLGVMLIKGFYHEAYATYASRQLLSYFYSICVNGEHQSNTPIWFLLTLYIVKSSYFYINKLFGKKGAIAFISFVTLTFVYVANFYNNILTLPLWLYNSLLGLFFFDLGVCFKSYKPSKFQLISFLVIYLFGLFFAFSFVDFKNNIVLDGNYFLWFIMSFLGILIVVNCKFGSIIEKSHLLRYIGYYSIRILVFHWLVYYVFRDILERTPYRSNSYYLFIMYLILLILLIPVFIKITNYPPLRKLVGG